MHYQFRIADFCWQWEIPHPVTIHHSSREFVTEAGPEATAGNRVTLERAEALSPLPADAVTIDRRHYTEKDGEKLVFFCTRPGSDPYVEVHFQPNGDIYGRFLESAHNTVRFTTTLIDLFGLEYLMLYHGGMLLHSCLIRYQGEGILFSAPSGTGKSTQGDLWTQYRGAEVLNGDRAGLYRQDGRWRATGLPYAGSSGVYRNENVPIRAIVYLAQGPENRISRLSSGQAFRLLYPQITVHHWEPDFVNQISDQLIQLLGEVPVYYLSCTPDEGAVEALEQQLSEER